MYTMSTYTETRVISLNSEHADTYNNGTYLSDLAFTLQGLLKDEPDIINKQITLANAQIPVSFYIVNYTNNVLLFNNGASNFNISIPVGNYNSSTFITALQAAILAQAGFSITITISKSTGILTFTSASVFTLNANSSAYQLIGLDLKTNLTASLVSSTYTAIPSYPCNLLGIKQLQIKSSTISSNNFSSNSNGQSTLLATVPVSVGAWGLINFMDTAGNNISFNNATLDGIDIQITDAETNKNINFWNINWTMTILLHITRVLSTNLSNISKPLITNLPIVNDILGNKRPGVLPKSKYESELEFLQQ